MTDLRCTLQHFCLLCVNDNQKTSNGAVKRAVHAEFWGKGFNAFTLKPFHAPAELLLVLNVKLMAFQTSKVEPPQCADL